MHDTVININKMRIEHIYEGTRQMNSWVPKLSWVPKQTFDFFFLKEGMHPNVEPIKCFFLS